MAGDCTPHTHSAHSCAGVHRCRAGVQLRLQACPAHTCGHLGTSKHSIALPLPSPPPPYAPSKAEGLAHYESMILGYIAAEPHHNPSRHAWHRRCFVWIIIRLVVVVVVVVPHSCLTTPSPTHCSPAYANVCPIRMHRLILGLSTLTTLYSSIIFA